MDGWMDGWMDEWICQVNSFVGTEEINEKNMEYESILWRFLVPSQRSIEYEYTLKVPVKSRVAT